MAIPAAQPVEKPLTAKQNLFVIEYAKSGNGIKSAVTAGYSERTAGSQAATLLGRLKIRRALRDEQDCNAKRTRITAARILREYARIAFTNKTDFLDEAGQLLMPSEWTVDMGHAVQEVYHNAQGQLVRIKLWPKQAALEALGKHGGLFVDRQEVVVTVEKIERHIVDSTALEHAPDTPVLEHDNGEDVVSSAVTA